MKLEYTIESIQQKHKRLQDELKAEKKENLILAKKIYLKHFELDNGLLNLD